MKTSTSHNQGLLTLSCPDQIGVVAAVTAFLAKNGCNITESSQFSDADNGQFFLRIAFTSPNIGPRELQNAFEPIRHHFHMRADFHCGTEKVRTLVMVSRLGHCLNDLLYRSRIEAIPIDVRAVISNHLDFEKMTTDQAIPFHHLPVSAESKTAQESKLIELIDEYDIELIVLARYMQVMSEAFCARYSGRIINIHHSFLPSFKGAKPYHRAHQRGVKLIGATAHYVTADLDEGPIIEQAVERVRHNFTPEDLVTMGRDVETVVLARAVQWHAERRVFLNDCRTVIFQ